MPITNLVILEDVESFPVEAANLIKINPSDYLSSELIQKHPTARVFNLCRSYDYQTTGYYVSLLAEARGHSAVPSVTTLRDFGSALIARSLGEEIDEDIQQGLRREIGDTYRMWVYFGQVSRSGLQRLAAKIYRLFPTPILIVDLVRKGRWMLSQVGTCSPGDLDDDSRATFLAAANDFFQRRANIPKALKQRFQYDLAILVNEKEAFPPSNQRALAKFTEAAREVGFYTEYITTEDADRICEFDALFIRETTAVDHPTYHMSRLAHAEGLVVIDDPWSILRCANKIYLNEVMMKAKVASPRTWILNKDSIENGLVQSLPLPCILKVPDAAFSTGVFKVETTENLVEQLSIMLEESEIILAQEFMPSEFDWRIGILDHQPLYACKYYMAQGHWQIYNWKASDPKSMAGESETVHVEFAPQVVIETALKATRLIGDGLYGVDLKQVGNRAFVIEVNDNPNIDAGIEDKALGMELYNRIARSLRRRIEYARA